MDQLDIVLQSFRDAVEADAKKERAALESETEQLRQKQTEQARDDLLNQTYYFIQSESEKLRNATNQKLSQRSIELHNELLSKRRKIEDDVFRAVRLRCREYANSPEYRTLLLKLLKKHEDLLREQAFSITVMPLDMRYEQDIKAACPLCSVSASDAIKIGGFEATSPDGNYRIVETLDRKFNLLRERFSENPELII